VNRYANQDLFIARIHHERLLGLVSRAEQQEVQPFDRQVDAWWAAMAIGVQRGERTPLPADQVKFNDGGILTSDSWRITHLELLALSEGDPEILEKPREVIRLASEYANAGFPYILEHLVGQPEPTLSLVARLDEIAGISSDEISAER